MISNQEINRNLVHCIRGAAAHANTHFRRAAWLHPWPNPAGGVYPRSDKIASQRKLVYFRTLLNTITYYVLPPVPDVPEKRAGAKVAGINTRKRTSFNESTSLPAPLFDDTIH